MKTSLRLKKMSKFLLRLVVFLGLISVAIAVLRWLVLDNPNLLPPTVATYITAETLTFEHRLSGFVIELLPLAAALYTLASLYRICIAYCQGEVFTQETGAKYRKFGKGLILLAAANGLYTSILTATFSLLSEAQELVLALGLSTADLYLLVVGLAVLMLGNVMDEAYRINEENSQIV